MTYKITFFELFFEDFILKRSTPFNMHLFTHMPLVVYSEKTGSKNEKILSKNIHH